jgi:hypothetical protein
MDNNKSSMHEWRVEERRVEFTSLSMNQVPIPTLPLKKAHTL